MEREIEMSKFTCDICAKEFSRKRVLQKHITTVHLHNFITDETKVEMKQSQKKPRLKNLKDPSKKRRQYFIKLWLVKLTWARKSSRGNEWVLYLQCTSDGITTLKRHSNSIKHRDRVRAVEIERKTSTDLELSEKLSSVTMRARKLNIGIVIHCTA